MDADDVCISERFVRQMGQIGPMDIHYSIVSDVSPELTEQKKLAAYLLFENPIIHSSVMVKSEVLKLNKYNSEIKFAQDYDLWLRISKKYPLIILDSVLYLRRYHENSISSKGIMKQEEFAEIARKKNRYSISYWMAKIFISKSDIGTNVKRRLHGYKDL
jgi:hypothetical protein